jgi:hypothetical protein
VPRHFGFGGDDFVDDVADQGRPAGGFRQLRRSCRNMVKTLADTGDHRLDLIPRRMGKCEQQAGLAGVLSQSGDTGEQQWTAGDCLQACLWMRQADIPTPPVVN